MCYYNILKDIKSYSTINASVCVLDKPVKPVTFDEAMNKVRKIKEEAAKNYDPEAWDKIDAQIAENKKV